MAGNKHEKELNALYCELAGALFSKGIVDAKTPEEVHQCLKEEDKDAAEIRTAEVVRASVPVMARLRDLFDKVVKGMDLYAKELEDKEQRR